MTQDLNKGVLGVTYNTLNLPVRVDILSPVAEARNEYTYSAGGQKLKVVRKWNSAYSTNPIIGTNVNINTNNLNSTKTTDYVGNIIYENGVLKRILTDNGYYENGNYYFYIKNHLGSNVMAATKDGNIVQSNHYYPFGLTMGISDNQGVQPYKYTGKELDMEHGLMEYDYEARQYDPAIGRFTTIDPLAEKYYSISPYAYSLNNPIRFIDPDGREVWIYYEDEEGKRQQILYTANMQYEGNNSFVSTSVNYLNSVYNNGGTEVMDVLIGSSNSFNMLNQTPTDNNGNALDALQFDEAAGGGGNIYAGMLMNSQYSNYAKIEGVSHELFHGFQYEKGQGGSSIFNEVEAMVYSSVISDNWLSNNPNYLGALSSNGLGNGTASGNLYQQSFNSLVNNGFSKDVFHDAVKAFKAGSNSNASGGYNNYPLVRTPESYLLKQYHPNRPIQ